MFRPLALVPLLLFLGLTVGPLESAPRIGPSSASSKLPYCSPSPPPPPSPSPSSLWVTLTGRVSSSPRQFAVNLYHEASSTIAVHLNTRWYEGRTLLNSYSPSSGWAQEVNVSSAFHRQLAPNSTFTLTMRTLPGENAFEVSINGERVTFARARPWSPLPDSLNVTKMETNDVTVQSITFKYNNNN